MEQVLSYIILVLGWTTLLIGSFWIWKHSTHLKGSSKTFLNSTLVSFYMLAYSSTMYLTDQPMLIGVIPVFIVFSALISQVVVTLLHTEDVSQKQ